MGNTGTEIIYVKAVDTSGVTALWDRNPLHPGSLEDGSDAGEVFVSGDVVAKAALTPEIARAIDDGRIYVVNAKGKPVKAFDAPGPDQPVSMETEDEPVDEKTPDTPPPPVEDEEANEKLEKEAEDAINKVEETAPSTGRGRNRS